MDIRIKKLRWRETLEVVECKELVGVKVYILYLGKRIQRVNREKQVIQMIDDVMAEHVFGGKMRRERP